MLLTQSKVFKSQRVDMEIREVLLYEIEKK